MDLGLTDKAVLVLASSKGIGRAIAAGYAAEGARVMMASRHKEQLEQAAGWIKEITGREVSTCPADVRQKDDITQLVDRTVEAFGTVDVLINNAGGPPVGYFEDFGDENWQAAFELNLLSVIRSVRSVLPHMKKQGGGRIVNIASSSIKQPIDGLILSNTFRTGLVGLAKSLASEYAKDNILVNTVGPGQIKTDRLAAFDMKKAAESGISQEEWQRKKEAQIPMGRYGTPEEFARIVLFLGSYANTYVTGQAFLADGGMVKAL